MEIYSIDIRIDTNHWEPEPLLEALRSGEPTLLEPQDGRPVVRLTISALDMHHAIEFAQILCHQYVPAPTYVTAALVKDRV